LFCVCFTEGDVLSGTSSSGAHHTGVLEGWFGEHWWNARAFVLLITTLFIFSPLACFKRIGKLSCTWSERVNVLAAFSLFFSCVSSSTPKEKKMI
jgi:sodium-coupled neutral amino acid transporter 2